MPITLHYSAIILSGFFAAYMTLNNGAPDRPPLTHTQTQQVSAITGP